MNNYIGTEGMIKLSAMVEETEAERNRLVNAALERFKDEMKPSLERWGSNTYPQIDPASLEATPDGFGMIFVYYDRHGLQTVERAGSGFTTDSL